MAATRVRCSPCVRESLACIRGLSPVNTFVRLSDCHSISDLEKLARRRLPRPVYHYLVGAAETEATAERNVRSFDDVRLVPRCLVDVSKITTKTRILGQELAWPVFCSSTGASRFYHPEGELAVARAASKSGSLYALAVAGSTSLEVVAAETTGPKMFQLFLFKDRGLTRALIERCRQAAYPAICLTVDVAARGKRERELRSGMGVPPKLSLRTMASMVLQLNWSFGQWRKGPLSLANIAGHAKSANFADQSKYFGAQVDPAVSWQDARELIKEWNGPFAIKGILSVEDAHRAVDAGATAIIISNHGGRQLDGAVSPFDVLPQIAEAVGGRVEVILDGGIRRGVHVLKALALGADACSIGRAYLFGLAAGGEAGVARALEILSSELVRAMQLCGCVDLKAIDRKLVQGRSE
jgi:L-lactate dehydrogenase (cytochrome)